MDRIDKYYTKTLATLGPEKMREWAMNEIEALVQELEGPECAHGLADNANCQIKVILKSKEEQEAVIRGIRTQINSVRVFVRICNRS